MRTLKSAITRRKWGIYLTFLITYGFLLFLAGSWFNDNFQVRSPIVKRDHTIVSPVSTKKTSMLPKVEVANAETSNKPTDYQIANYISSKRWDYNDAIRIAKSENAWNRTKSFDCSRTGGPNSDGTYDHGLWQINDIHIQSGAISLADANDCYRSTNFALKLYQRSGWQPWSAYTNGSYLGHEVIQL